jgi:tetratricopeptide (TPR) repeat protein
MLCLRQGVLSLIWTLSWLVTAPVAVCAAEVPSPTPIDRAFARMYNLDFSGTHAILDAEVRDHPDNPLIYSVRGAAHMLSEFSRLKILEFEFFEDDDKVTDRKKLKPDPTAREQLFKMTAEARKRALARLAVDPNDSNALFALSMAAGVETDYVGFVEKKYFRTYSLSKENQQYAHKLLAMNPPINDAYLTLGTVEYVVSKLNFFFRLFIRFDQIEGNKLRAIENLRKVIASGRYYPPFAKILLSVIYLRDRQPQQALILLKELARDYPDNGIFRNQVNRASELANQPQISGRRRP